MSAPEDTTPPPPPAEEEAPPPPAPESDDDDEKGDGEFAEMGDAPPPPPEKFAMDAKEAETTGLSNLKKKLFELSLQDLIDSKPGSKSPMLQMIGFNSQPIPCKAIFALVIFLHDWDTVGVENADLLDLDWTDFDTPQVQAFLKAHGLEQADAYPKAAVTKSIEEAINTLLEKTEAVDLVPSMLEFASVKMAEKLSLSSNMTFRMTIDLGKQ